MKDQTHGFYEGQVVRFTEKFRLFTGSVEDWQWTNIKKGSKATVARTGYGFAPWAIDWRETQCWLKIDYIDGYREFQVPMSVLEPDNALERIAMAITEQPVDPLVEMVRSARSDNRAKGRRPR
jgi:hypothetical protein